MHLSFLFIMLAVGSPWSLWSTPTVQKQEERSLGPDRIIVVSATWCGPCRQIKPQLNAAQAAMEKTGWKFGTTQNNHVQYLDYNKDKEFCSKLGSITLPYIVKIEDGKVVRRHSFGNIDSWSLSELHKGFSERPKQQKKPPQAVFSLWSKDD